MKAAPAARSRAALMRIGDFPWLGLRLNVERFDPPADVAERDFNRNGWLLLLPKTFNASYGDLTCAEKLPHYLTQNLLALSLHPQRYEHNPGFLRFNEQSGLPFAPLAKSDKAELEARSFLYRQ